MLQYRGENAKLKNQERKGESRCYISGCCEGIDKQCFGCHPGLLAMGIPCEQQPTSVTETQRRDCFCDEICILFEDCCDDHFGACAGLYDVSSWFIIKVFLLMKPYFQPPESCARPEDIDVIDFSSKSSCELRGSCCSGGDLACHGCNPFLLSQAGFRISVLKFFFQLSKSVPGRHHQLESHF